MLKKMPKSPALPPKTPAFLPSSYQHTTELKNAAGQILHWKPAALHGRFPPHIQPWLADRGSLTAKLKQKCQHFEVQRLFEGWAMPLPSEQQKLKLPLGQKAWTRCVLLLCNGVPVVYARTLIPNFTPGNPWLQIQHLGNQPLGELLFQLPNLQRSPFEFCQTLAHWPYLPIENPQPLQRTQARRCLFQQDNAPLLLTEVFITQLPS